MAKNFVYIYNYTVKPGRIAINFYTITHFIYRAIIRILFMEAYYKFTLTFFYKHTCQHN